MAHDPLRTVKRVLPAAALVVIPLVASPAQASVGSDRAAAAQVMRQLDRLDARRSALAARQEAVRARLQEVSTAIATTREAIVVEQAELDSARTELAAEVVGAYKSGTPDAAAYVLGAVSFADMVDRVDVLDQIDQSQTALIGRIRRASAGLDRQRQALRSDREIARTRAAELRAASGRLEAAIASRRRILGAIHGRIRAELAAEARRRNRLARRDSAPPAGPGAPSGPSFSGEGTWYGPGFAGHRTADGEIFDPNKLTAASPWLPFDTIVRVTSSVTGQSVTVRINDRGPFGRGVIDLSAHAARIIHLVGWTEVQVVILRSG